MKWLAFLLNCTYKNGALRCIFPCSVADPGCIPDPDFCPSRIPDPKKANKSGIKNRLSYLFVATNITKKS
jgi:hypothetical protein